MPVLVDLSLQLIFWYLTSVNVSCVGAFLEYIDNSFFTPINSEGIFFKEKETSFECVLCNF